MSKSVNKPKGFKIKTVLINIIVTNVTKLLRARLSKINFQITTLNTKDLKELKDYDNKLNVTLDYFQLPFIESDGETIVGKIDKKSKYVLISRNKPTKQDIESELSIFLGLIDELIKTQSANQQNKEVLKEIKIFESKQEFVNYFVSLLGKRILKQRTILKFLKNLWINIKKHEFELKDDNSCSKISSEIEEQIYLSFFNISYRQYDIDHFELHRAVMQNDLRTIRKICALESTDHIICDINEPDPNNNTPLMLAIKLKNFDAVCVLCDHDADIKHCSFIGDISPIKYAISIEDRKLIKILSFAYKKQKIFFWQQYKKEVIKQLRQIPDFSLEMKLNLDSNLFNILTQHILNDSYKISKLRGNLRIDLNISNMNTSLRNLKGKYSILVQDKDDDCSILKLDNEKNTSLAFIDDEDVAVQDILDDGIDKENYYFKKVHYKEEDEYENEKILSYDCKKTISNSFLFIIKPKHLKPEYELKEKFKNFEEYFKNALVERTHYENELKEEHNKRKKEYEKKKKYSHDKILKKKSFLEKIPDSNSDSSFENTKDYNDIKDLKESKNDKYIITKNSKISTKEINIDIWSNEDFPIKSNFFNPILDIMSIASPELAKLKYIINNEKQPFTSLPLKFGFPLGFMFSAMLNISSYSMKTPEFSTFEIPDSSVSDFISKNLFTDDHFTNSFYDKYFQENKQNYRKLNLDDEFQDRESELEKARELFDKLGNDDVSVSIIEEKFNKLNNYLDDDVSNVSNVSIEKEFYIPELNEKTRSGAIKTINNANNTNNIINSNEALKTNIMKRNLNDRIIKRKNRESFTAINKTILQSLDQNHCKDEINALNLALQEIKNYNSITNNTNTNTNTTVSNTVETKKQSGVEMSLIQTSPIKISPTNYHFQRFPKKCNTNKEMLDVGKNKFFNFQIEYFKNINRLPPKKIEESFKIEDSYFNLEQSLNSQITSDFTKHNENRDVKDFEDIKEVKEKTPTIPTKLSSNRLSFFKAIDKGKDQAEDCKKTLKRSFKAMNTTNIIREVKEEKETVPSLKANNISDNQAYNTNTNTNTNTNNNTNTNTIFNALDSELDPLDEVNKKTLKMSFKANLWKNFKNFNKYITIIILDTIRTRGKILIILRMTIQLN